MKLGFDVPGQRRFAVLMEDHIVAMGVDVLRVNQKTVHVKQACSDFRETDSSRLVWIYGRSTLMGWRTIGIHILVLACCHCWIGLER